MGLFQRSARSAPSRARSTQRRAAHRHFRPRAELLEGRRLLAAGLFNENFSDDLDLSLPGFDEADIYPARDINPSDPSDTTYDDPATLNTVAPDELRIVNDLPRYGPATPAVVNGQFLYNRYHLAPGGPTNHSGYYQILEWSPDDDPTTSLPNGHYLFASSGVVLGPLVDFTFPIQPDESISVVAFSLEGFCRCRIRGANGVLGSPLLLQRLATRRRLARPAPAKWPRIRTDPERDLPRRARRRKHVARRSDRSGRRGPRERPPSPGTTPSCSTAKRACRVTSILWRTTTIRISTASASSRTPSPIRRSALASR